MTIVSAASVTIPAAKCSAIQSGRQLRITVKPINKLYNILGYTTSVETLDLTSMINLECTAGYLDLSTESFSLKDSAGNDINEIEVDDQTEFGLNVNITLGPTASVTPFTASGQNYEYRFYLAKQKDMATQQISKYIIVDSIKVERRGKPRNQCVYDYRFYLSNYKGMTTQPISEYKIIGSICESRELWQLNQSVSIRL